jgi:hypothetical protein
MSAARNRTDLAAAQEALVAALVAGGPLPPGFDPRRVGAAGQALLRKRAGEVAKAWPWLAREAGWRGEFLRWAAGRPPRGGWRDGWDFARERRDTLGPAALRELALNEAHWKYDGERAPRPRRVAVRRVPGGVVVVVARWHRCLRAAASRVAAE